MNTPCLAVTDRFSYEKAVRTAALEELGPLARHLALTLATYLSKDGTIAARFTPSTTTLTAQLGYRPKNTHSVDEATVQLESAGYLVVTRSRGKRNRYQATVPAARGPEFPGVTAQGVIPAAPRTTAALDSGLEETTNAPQDSGPVGATTAAQSSGGTAAPSSGWSESTAAESSRSDLGQPVPQPSLSTAHINVGSAAPESTKWAGKGKKSSQNLKKAPLSRPRGIPGRSLADALTAQHKTRYRQMLDNMRSHFNGNDVLGHEGTQLVDSIGKLDQQTRFAEMLIGLDQLGHTALLTEALTANRNPSGTGTPYGGLKNKGAEAYRRIEELYATHGFGPARSLSDVLPDGFRVGNQVVPLPWADTVHTAAPAHPAPPQPRRTP